MAKFRLRTSEVEAIQVDTENLSEVQDFLGERLHRSEMNPDKVLRIIISNRYIEMMEGPEARFVARHGDWIIKQTEGNFHVISAKAFPRIYELIT